jgi:hypothetical protein
MTKPFILTRTGQIVYLIDPEPTSISIIDIAWGLSGEARYLNHSKWPYSVAQHSVYGARYLKSKSKTLAYDFLMHDATEAYLRDIPFMLKPLLPEYIKIEKEFNCHLQNIFKFNSDKDQVKFIDRNIAIDEIHSFMNYKDNEKYKEFLSNREEKPIGIKVVPWTRISAFNQFLKTYQELKPEDAPGVDASILETIYKDCNG